MKKIIVELKSLGCVYLTITGGEAFLHPQFKELYLIAYRAGFIISLFSNGYYIDKVIDFLSEHKPYEIDITLYGVDDDSYLQNTGVLAGKKVLDNLHALKERNITFSLKAAVTKKILPYIDKMRSIAKQYDVTFRSDFYIYLSREQAGIVERLTPTEIADIVLKDEPYVELERKEMKKALKNEGQLLFNCHPGETNIYITWNGQAKMCPFTSEEHSVVIGEKGKTIKEAREYLQKIGSVELSKDSKCYTCEYSCTCKRCPERFFIETGSFIDPPCWMCETAQMIYTGIVSKEVEEGRDTCTLL